MTTPLALFNHGPIRQIRLARPPVNALDTELCRALIGAIEQAHSDGVQGIVLSGGEGIFSAGMDVPELMAHGDDRARLPAPAEEAGAVLARLHRLRETAGRQQLPG